MRQDSVVLWIVILLGSAITTFGAVWVFIKLAPKIGSLARPTVRGSHESVVPTGAGIVVFAVAAIFLYYFYDVYGLGPFIPAFLICAAAISALGYLDDIRPLPLFFRLLLQIAIVLAFVRMAGPYQFLFDLPVSLGVIVTMMIIVVFINVFNFMDGSDGIVALHGLLVMVAWAIIGVTTQSKSLTISALIFAGAWFGFLLLNWHPARVFLGDAGSTLVGFVLAALPLISFGGESNPIGNYFWAVLLFSFIFILDAAFNRVRRIFVSSKFWEPNRDHFYQRMIDAGTSQSVVAALYGLMTVIMIAATSFALFFGGFSWSVVAAAAFIMFGKLYLVTSKKTIDLNI